MNRSSVFVVIIGIAFGSITVSSRNTDSTELVLNSTTECRDEWREFKNQVNRCGPEDFQIYYIFDAIKAYRNQTIDNTEFSRMISEYCPAIKIATDCSMEKYSTISSECRQNTKIQSLNNLMRIINRINADICSESIIYDIANDDGYSCVSGVKLGRCFKDIQLPDGSDLNDDNVCATGRTVEACIDTFFNDCQSTGKIQEYGKQIINSLLTDFSCAK